MKQAVTCIVPVHNGERYLGETLESILGQTYSPLDVVVVDNGSSDASAEIARSFGERVRVFGQEDLGPPGGRNRGIRESDAPFLAFCDADDLFMPEKIERQMARFEALPGLDISLCTAECFWEEGLEEERRRYEELRRTRATHVFATTVARRTVFDRVGLLDVELRFGDVIEWFTRAGNVGLEIDVLPDVLVARRMHIESMTHRDASLDPYFELVHRRIRARREGA